jgi:alpha-D-ribose 1-methylphosphonate 5-triphosphate diphosphatase
VLSAGGYAAGDFVFGENDSLGFEMEIALTPRELVFKNARIVTPSEVIEGSVHVCDGTIVEISGGRSSVATAIDLEGDYLLPGLVDVHTDNLERLLMPRAGADWPVMAALVAHDAQIAAAGITTVLDALCVGTMGQGVRNFEKVKEAVALTDVAKQNQMFRSEHVLHLRVELTSEHTPAMFSQLSEHPDLVLVSLMDHTPGQRQYADREKLVAFIAMEKRDARLSQEQIREMVLKLEEQQQYSEANRRAVLAMVAHRPIALASHDDTTVEHVEQSYAEGLSVSEFPTTKVAAKAARAQGMRVVAGSPNLVLGRSHSGNVSVEELARCGLLDVLASDYVPSSLLHGAFLLVEKLGTPLPEAIRMVSLSPARLIGQDDRGSVETGKRADLVRVRQVQGLPLPLMVWRAGERIA